MSKSTSVLFKYGTRLSLFFFLTGIFWLSNAHVQEGHYTQIEQPGPPDSLPYPLQSKDPFSNKNDNKLYLDNPKNISTDIEYDPATNQYRFVKKIGDNIQVGDPDYMTFSDYQQYDFDKRVQEYWRERTSSSSIGQGKSLIPKINIGGQVFDRIFGSNSIDIRPQGSAELIFGVNATNRQDPALDEKQRKTANFNFDEKIQLNVTAKIGDKIQLGVNYNTESSFEFENKMKLEYEGKEDEIIKKIEAGDVTLPLSGSLITGSQALFGLKTALQFGKTTVTTVLSQQKSKSSTIEVSNGAQKNYFELKADQYDENKHFFVSQYFRNNYERSLNSLPLIASSVNITKIEVWVTSIGPAINESRNIIAFQDLGEKDPYNPQFVENAFLTYPSNRINNLYDMMTGNSAIRNINNVSPMLAGYGLVSGTDFEKIENARKLSPNEYTFNSKLGFISVNSAMSSDEVLAVAYQYTIIGDTATYQVGEFSNEGISSPQALIVKLLKSTTLNPKLPMWDLMMKNVYSIGAYQINNQDFRLNILYANDETGVPSGYLSEGAIKGVPLIRVFKLDKLNSQLDPAPDGVFDFIDGAGIRGGTINANNGKVFFPVLEPFGKFISDTIGDPIISDKYAFTALYDSTKSTAQQFPEKNKFYLKGSYKSSVSSDISLNAMNVPQGSVTVTSGGIKLTENVDYTVDYTLGRVKIINEGVMNSGSPIRISLESNETFSFQTKTLIGIHADHKVSNDFTLGATMLNLTERPMTQKINIGEDPISNTIWGVDGTYKTEVPLVTKIVDKIPFIDTKEKSNFTISGEFAQLVPGHSRAIGKSGTSYIDDFEASKSSIVLNNQGAWKLASTPQGQPTLFPEGNKIDNLSYGKNRALLSWYVIDPSVFNRNTNVTPDHIKKDVAQQSNHYVREILETEVFPNSDPPNGQPINIATLNLSFYPTEKGPYNFDVKPEPGISAGINSNGSLLNPASRWGGIMRKIETTDFESTNVEYIEFWMMDPFAYTNGQNGNPLHSGGELYINLGDVSEDILRDSRKSYENGLPVSATLQNIDTTKWGRIPTIQSLVNTFDNNPESRQYQDVGLDGLSDQDELSFYEQSYLQVISNFVGASSTAYQQAISDPSNDDYHYYRGTDYDQNQVSILNRYKKYNGMEGNSPTSDQSKESYPTQATTMPDIEDINRDNTLSENERYFQYRIVLKPDQMVVGQNYITDMLEANVTLKNGNNENIKWYQFKVPIQNPSKVVGSISDFKSIRFMRMFLRNFQEEVHLRFATLDLVRSEWRKYKYTLLTPGEYVPNDNLGNTGFELSAVNIEENGKRVPIPYVLPPTIERETAMGTTNVQRLNEQSLVLKVCKLQDGDARAVYKTTDFDIRQYQKLKMYIHAEPGSQMEALNKGDLTVFIRLGTDFNNNYYEYEVPLTPTSFSATLPNDIWPLDNMMDITLNLLQDAKQKRNVAMRDASSGVLLSTPYVVMDGDRRITVVGMPNLSAVKTIMIGIRNPKQVSLSGSDDGLEKCAEIWVNELRLTDFDEKGGWAANARISGNLADLGSVSFAGHTSTPGFGGIEQKLDQRSKEQVLSYDMATAVELGKFFPEKSGITIPLHFDFSESFSNPEYNPNDPDILFKDALNSYDDQHLKDSLKQCSQDYTKRKSVNFINMKKNKTNATAKNHVYDISNFDFTYAYTEMFHRNIEIEYNTQKTYKGAIGYNFANNPKPIEPFKKLKPKYLRIIKDFNFYLSPKLLSFRTDMDRQYSESMLRNTTGADMIIEPTYVKNWIWNRQYAFKYDLSKSLKVEFNANNQARVDEPYGKIDKANSDYERKKDTILQNISSFGRNTLYNHDFNVNYALPINKIGILNWVTVNTKYSGEYRWQAAPIATQQLGNTIENSNSKQINGQLNFVTLYNKINYLKNLNTVKPKAPKPVIPPTEADTAKKETPNYLKLVLDNTLKLLMGVKNASLSYTQSNGTFLPGYMPNTQALGQNWNKMSPGTGFIFGQQSNDFVDRAGREGWISNDPMLNIPTANKFAENISGRATIEPIKDFKIELTATRNYTNNKQQYYKCDSLGNFNSFSPSEGGNLSMTYLTWKTAFIPDDNKTHVSEVFETMRDNRIIIAQRLADQNPVWKENKEYIKDTTSGLLYPSGYGPTSQEVLIPSFLAAYSGKDAKKIGLSKFPKIPMPNWRITYNGLMKIDFFKQYFKSFTLGHAYRSTYNVGSYTYNTRWKSSDLDDDFTRMREDLGYKNYINKYDISQVTISEQFGPLLNVDMTWNNSLTTKVELKKSRDMALSLTNNQLTEVNGTEYVFGLGYRVKNIEFAYKSGGKTNRLKSDVNVNSNVSVRTNKTVLRKLVENSNQVSSGQRIISINVSADYQISKSLSLRVFFDKIINNPFVSSQFKNSNTNAGLSLRFNLAQ